jgi:hypothetical protein
MLTIFSFFSGWIRGGGGGGWGAGYGLVAPFPGYEVSNLLMAPFKPKHILHPWKETVVVASEN